MAKKKEEQIEYPEIKGAALPLPPLHSNVVRAVSHTDFLLLDFGFFGPSYAKPYSYEDNHIARICLDWDSCDILLEQLKLAVKDRTEDLKSSKGSKGSETK